MIININFNNLHDKQKELMTSIVKTPVDEHKYHIIRASRQCGKTHLLERVSLYLALEKNNSINAFIMATNPQTRKVHKNMITWIPKSLIKKTTLSDGYRSIQLINGSNIIFYSSLAYDSVVGSSFDNIVADEFGLWHDNAWSFIKPTIAAKPLAKVIIASTPRGKNTFYDLCMLSNTSSRYKQHRMSYLDNPYYDISEVDDARLTMTEALFKQEYLAEFIDGINNVFGDINNISTVNEYPEIDPEKKYYGGIDWASTNDRLIVTIMDSVGKVCYIEQIDFNLNSDERIDRVNEIIMKYRAFTYSEKNGIGDYPTSLLLDRYKNPFILKYTTTNQSKINSVSQLLSDINYDNIQLPTRNLEPELHKELDNYVVSQSTSGNIIYGHTANNHDDYIDSIMMCNQIRHKMSGNHLTIVSDMLSSTDRYLQRMGRSKSPAKTNRIF